MADFYYKPGITNDSILKFNKLYSNKRHITKDFTTFYNNNTTTHVEQGNNSITILGYAYTTHRPIEIYLANLLSDFDEHQIAEIKKQLLGQYIVILHKEDSIYLFSDFLQTRNIYYAQKEQSVCSSFGVLHQFQGNQVNEYKAFEFLAMRHCLYPTWLGNTTLNDNIKRLRAYEYLKIDTNSNIIQVKDYQFMIDNVKIESLKKLRNYTYATLQNTIYHSKFQNEEIYTTITGGFDSRFVTTLIQKYYTNYKIRISSRKDVDSLDMSVAQKVAKALSMPLKVYETDPQKQIEDFYFMTDGMAPRENLIMTQLFQTKNRGALEFGGTFGTELYTAFPYNNYNELVEAYLQKIKEIIEADENYYHQFKQSLHDEFEDIHAHYKLEFEEPKDYIRIFQLLETGFFSSSFISATNILGKQYEVFGTYPVIEAGLKIPYHYLGSKRTFGRFYFIPKILMERLNKKISKIETTHFCPMRPLSIFSFISYLSGRIKSRNYYKHLAQDQHKNVITKTLKTKHFSYTSNNWFEGFQKEYFPTRE